MNVNPKKLMQMRNGWNQFTERHPKLPKFFRAASQSALQEGTVLEMKITMPDGETMESNIRLTAEDIAFVNEAKETFVE